MTSYRQKEGCIEPPMGIFVRSGAFFISWRVIPCEIVVALVVTDCGRPHPRIGGLKMEEAKKEDGRR